MSAKQMAIQEAERHGVKLEFGGIPFEIIAPAPFRHHWKDEYLHELVESQWDHERTEGMWRAMLARVKQGVKPCTAESCQMWEDGECEWWSESDERS